MIAAVLFFLASAVLIDLIGYWLHRWIHVPGSWGYRAHMTHHVTNYPARAFFSSRYRSSRADSLVLYFAPFAAAYGALVLCLGLPHPVAILAGAGVSVLLSSLLHDLTHIQGSIVWRWGMFGSIAARHHLHHFKMGRNFGILVPWWDLLFRTRRARARSRAGTRRRGP
jgi:sterol desaturase/sphingolipid hydroxylase (fatty acid hydroxylase superfamily)